MIKTYKVLEFDKILAQLSSYTSSEPVIDRIKNMKMLPEKEAVKAQRETTEAVAAMLRQGNLPVNLSVPDIRGAMKRTQIGAILNPTELMSAARVLYVARRMKTYIGDSGSDLEILSGLQSALCSLKGLEDRISSVILSETEIADDASATLSALRLQEIFAGSDSDNAFRQICNSGEVGVQGRG